MTISTKNADLSHTQSSFGGISSLSKNSLDLYGS